MSALSSIQHQGHIHGQSPKCQWHAQISGAAHARRQHTTLPCRLLAQQRQLTSLVVASSVANEPASSVGTIVRPVQSLAEMAYVARLRGEAYHEGNNSRFVGSLIKKFVGQEIESLQQRTRPPPGAGAPEVECLVALGEGGSVVGCIDIRLPRARTGCSPVGVPVDDTNGSYLYNVVVQEDLRGQGIGKTIMAEAMQRAAHHWNAANLYTEVSADNEVAYRLYKGCGFTEFSADEGFAPALKLGRLVLLCAPATAVPGRPQ